MSSTISPLPPLKRKRLDTNPAEGATTALTRSTNLWFEDGSIVLEVETTQFRVHKSILGANSSFFKDIFAFPKPEDKPLIEGCVVVFMHGTSEDWMNLLTFMYFPTTLPPLTAIFPVSVAISVLRLSKTYKFDSICSAMHQWLTERIPKTIEGAQTLRKLWPWDTIFEIINVAEELDIKSVLPTAYYVCTVSGSIDFDDIMAGTYHNDHCAVLSYESSRAILRGRELVRDCLRSRILLQIMENGSTCTTSKKCNLQQIKMVNNAVSRMEDFVKTALDADPMYMIEARFFLCDDCYAKALASHRTWRQKFWDALLHYFEMPAWDDIMDFQN